ncbi:MAG: uridine diphosphate-N-acetylglucosamine-binding protein YvcK [Candidatus Rokubacteria bacterium]|nr:uridine diphosphate-N-acetylglucosamine-binding protein YvcK [Candidatus Rokubacteria bacterium]
MRASLMVPVLPRGGVERSLSRVVALGGGTGLPVVLSGLRRHLPARCRITAIVTAADDGGSSGILRRQYGVLPPGDIRNCLAALARVAPEVSAALQYRFDGGVVEHPVGNLLLTALDMVATDELKAIRLAAELLGVEDLVLPSTTHRVQLVADLVDGRSIHGESEIPRGGAPITRVRIDPADATAAPGVLEALDAADAMILGPGSLYTSLLATLVVPGVAEAVARSEAVRIFVCNVMTEPGETTGYGVAEHLGALAAHGLPAGALDYVVVNTTPIPPKVRARYAAQGAGPVDPDFVVPAEPPVILRADLLEPGPVVRHAAGKLGPILCNLAARHVDWARDGQGR